VPGLTAVKLKEIEGSSPETVAREVAGVRVKESVCPEICVSKNEMSPVVMAADALPAKNRPKISNFIFL